jgi:membrane-associated phospholipid phosphatase
MNGTTALRVAERRRVGLVRLAVVIAATVGVLHAPRAASAQAAAAPAPAAPTQPVLPPYTFQPGVLCPLCKVTPQYPHGRSGLHWHAHWQNVGVREYITVGALAAGGIGVSLFVSPPDEARWDKAFLFDNSIRDALRIDSRSGRKTAEAISDGLFVWEVLHPTILDPLLVAWWARESPFVAWQMLVIDAQAYSLTLLLTDVIKRVAARARPWVSNPGCEQSSDGEECGSGGRNVSFYSGHAAVTATGAGLICAHHTQLSLYQNNVLDTGMCALAVLGTAVTGAMRIASDNHWATDVLIGHLMGYTSGYLLPTLLYYKEFRATPHDHPEGPSYAALPLIRRDALGINLIGMF